jgi:hypothetical protein
MSFLAMGSRATALAGLLGILVVESAALFPSVLFRGEVLSSSALAYGMAPWKGHRPATARPLWGNPVLSADLALFTPWDAAVRAARATGANRGPHSQGAGRWGRGGSAPWALAAFPRGGGPQGARFPSGAAATCGLPPLPWLLAHGLLIRLGLPASAGSSWPSGGVRRWGPHASWCTSS